MRASGAAFGALAGALIALCSVLPVGAVAVVFIALGLVVAWGWPRLVNLPSPLGTSLVIALTAVALAAIMLVSPDHARSRWAGAVLCVGLIGSFLHQLLRQDGRPRLVMTLAGTALALGILGAGSYLLPDQNDAVARGLLVSSGFAVLTGCVLDGVAGATQRRLEFGVGQTVLGGLVGALAVIWADVPVWLAVATGALSALAGWACLRTTVTVATSAHTRAQLAGGAACALVSAFMPFALAPLA